MTRTTTATNSTYGSNASTSDNLFVDAITPSFEAFGQRFHVGDMAEVWHKDAKEWRTVRIEILNGNIFILRDVEDTTYYILGTLSDLHFDYVQHLISLKPNIDALDIF